MMNLNYFATLTDYEVDDTQKKRAPSSMLVNFRSHPFNTFNRKVIQKSEVSRAFRLFFFFPFQNLVQTKRLQGDASCSGFEVCSCRAEET